MKKIVNNLVMFGLIAMSGMPFFSASEISYVIFFIIVLLLYLKRDYKPIYINRFMIVFVFPLLLILIQSLLFEYFKLITVLGFIVRTLSAILVVYLLKEKFIELYIKQLCFFTIASFIVFIPISIFPGLLDKITINIPNIMTYSYELLGTIRQGGSLIIVNLNMDSISNHYRRNCGPFWEPGAFGGFLIVALLLNILRGKQIRHRSNILLILGLISTFSTMAYLGLFFLFIFYFVSERKSSLRKIVLTSIFGIIAVILFFNLDFLNNKIDNEISNTDYVIQEQGGNARLASAILDIQEFIDYPLSGRGIWPETRYNKGKFKYILRNNGLTGFLTTWGVGFFIIYFILLQKNFKTLLYQQRNLKLSFSIFAILIVIIISFSENYFNLMFFWALIIIPSNFLIKNEKNNCCINYKS